MSSHCTQVLYRFNPNSYPFWIESGVRSYLESGRIWIQSRSRSFMNSVWIQVRCGIRSCPDSVHSAFSLDFGPLWFQSGLGPLWMLPGVPPKSSSTDRTAHRCHDRLSSFSARCHSDSFSVDVAVCAWLQWCSLPALFSFSLYASASFSQAISLRWIITLGTAEIRTELIWRHSSYEEEACRCIRDNIPSGSVSMNT